MRLMVRASKKEEIGTCGNLYPIFHRRTKRRSHPSSTEPRSHSFPPVHSTRVFNPPRSSWTPDPKVIMQYRDDFVGSSRSYFSLFRRQRTLASVVTIIYEGCVPGIQRAHLTCEVTYTRGRMASSSELEEGKSR